VIAGHKAAVERAAEAAKARGAKRAMLLPVSAPFHCSLMRPAAEKLRERLAQLDLAAPNIPVLNNVDVACVDDPQQIKDALVRQAAAPVRWVETMQAMQAAGISQVIECGPGKVLSGLVKRCADGLAGLAMADLAGLDAALAAIKEA
jgi:[acyl-carrier-protein] S-malonyltransferase